MSDDQWRDDVYDYFRSYMGLTPEDGELTPEAVEFMDSQIAHARETGWAAHGTKGTARIIAANWRTEVAK